jgi:predicted  nucleic acid-binding Zn-ribbon protein
MTDPDHADRHPDLRVSVENVGGIDELECRLGPGVNVVTGENASNKTSLLQAIAFGLGHPEVPVRSGADEARVELAVGERSTVRRARRTDAGVAVEGEPLLADGDAELMDRFARLLEFNDVRRAAREDGDVERLLKEPMDVDELERERSELIERKRDLRADVEEAADVEDRLERRREELTAARERVERLEAELDDLRERTAAGTDADEELAELRDRRSELVRERDEYETAVEDLREAIDRLDGRIDEVESELATAREAAEGEDLERLRSERASIRADREELTERIEVLQSVLTANREMLDSPHAGALGQDADLVEDAVTCWACGNEAAVSEFESTVEELQRIVERDQRRRREYDPELDAVEERIREAERARKRVSDLEDERQSLRRRRESREESLATKRERLTAVRDELAEVDAELADGESSRESERSDLTERVEETRLELHTARSEVDRLESTVEDLEGRRRERERKRERVGALDDEIAALTDRIENFEDDLRSRFNAAAADLLSALAFDRIERVWLDGEFELVVAREVDGVTRRDHLGNLSESERELVGLVLALAGYLAYDAADAVPVLLLDALGAFDADRTAALLAYFADEAPAVVAALLPDSTEAVRRADLDATEVRPVGGTEGRTARH